MNLSLYQRIGGEVTVQAVVNIFYDKFKKNNQIEMFFDGISMPNQVKIMQRFITIVLKGDTEYNRVAMRRAHAPLVRKGLNSYHVDLFTQTMIDSLMQLNVPKELIGEFRDISESYRDDVLNR